MSKKKLKFDPNRHRQLSHFISDLPLPDAIKTLDASEKDMPQIRSEIIEQTEDHALIEARFTNMITLQIFLEDWARGSQTKATVYKKQKEKIQKYQTQEMIETKQLNKLRSILGIILCITIILIFITGEVILYTTLSAFLIFMLLAVDFQQWSIANPEKSSEFIQIKDRHPYENILLQYIENKLNQNDDEIVFTDDIAKYQNNQQ